MLENTLWNKLSTFIEALFFLFLRFRFSLDEEEEAVGEVVAIVDSSLFCDGLIKLVTTDEQLSAIDSLQKKTNIQLIICGLSFINHIGKYSRIAANTGLICQGG